jgi:VWFA-related protein
MRNILKAAVSSVVALMFLGVAWSAPLAQSPPAPAAPETTIKTTTEEVVLDVVVRDKHGKPVNNLKADDFQITDNGEKRTVKSFRLVTGTESVTSTGERAPLDPLRQIRLLTFIFQCPELNSRRLARQAALDLLKSELPQNVYMSVMTIDHKLEAIQPFTNDRALLRKGIDRATGSDSTNFTADTDRVVNDLHNMIGQGSNGQSLNEQINGLPTGATAATGPGAAPNGASMANQLMAQMMLAMLQGEQRNAMAQAGRAEIFALLDAVKEQYRLPGRKTILYFSQGFVIPQGMEEPFKSVISIANRSNVSFYAIDVHGLSTESSNKAAIDQLNAASDASIENQKVGSAVSHNAANSLDSAIESTRGNTQNTLANLAESTGGALVANTNDFRTPLHRLTEDIQTYYEITYNPEIQNYDGSFRKIAVKMASGDYKVQSRSGYFALPPALAAKGAMVHAYEMPLLNALSAAQLPQAFAFQATGMHFRNLQNQPTSDLVVDVPLGNLTFEQNKTTGNHEGHLSYIALVKDEHGEIVKKFQNDLPLNVPAAKIAALKESHFIYTEHFDLPPGNYSLEVAMLDRQGNKISAKKSSLVVPAATGSLAISSVAVVRSLKDKDPTTSTTDPLLMGNKIVSPTLNPVVVKAATKGLPFYMVIYPDKGVSTPPELTMEFSRNGQVLGSGSPPLGKPDAEGRIPYVATAPVEQLEPGNYSIRFIVKQGAETADETVSFILQ